MQSDSFKPQAAGASPGRVWSMQVARLAEMCSSQGSTAAGVAASRAKADTVLAGRCGQFSRLDTSLLTVMRWHAVATTRRLLARDRWSRSALGEATRTSVPSCSMPSVNRCLQAAAKRSASASEKAS